MPASATGEPKPAYLVRGDDPALVADALHKLVEALVGSGDPAMVVEEHGAEGGDDPDVGRVLDALTTPPFLADRRVVVVREAGRIPSEGAQRIVQWMADPLDAVVLVLGSGGGTMARPLVQAVGAAGGIVDTAAGTGKARTAWLAERLHEAPVRFDAAAGNLLREHLGQDLSRLPRLIELVTATYGPGARVGAGELRPLLGSTGAVAPWELTDAIASGRADQAVGALERLLGPAALHPLAVLGVLVRHYQMVLALDGAPVTSPEDAAAAVGARSVFPVKKALEQARRLGSARVGRAIVLLADADLDLRGRSNLAPATVLEVLVSRLARSSARQTSGRQRRPAT